MGDDARSSRGLLSYILALIVLLIIILPAQSSSDKLVMSKPIITSGEEITEGDLITVSSNLSGKFAEFPWTILKSCTDDFVINITYDIELYEEDSKLWCLDEQLDAKSYSHIERFSVYETTFTLADINSLSDVLLYAFNRDGQATVELTEKGHSQSVYDVDTLHNLMYNLTDAPLDALHSDKDIFVKVRARGKLNEGYQKRTDWNRSDIVAVKVVRKPEPTLTYTERTFVDAVPRDSITLGESITIRAEGGNIGGKANEYSIISVSFPDLKGRDDARQVSVGDNNFYGPSTMEH